MLVGHSFGGAVISGVGDRMPERIRRLVYLDTMMLEHGQRPFDVLRPIAEGHSNRRIADVLSLSQRTIENRVLHILTKLDLDSEPPPPGPYATVSPDLASTL